MTHDLTKRGQGFLTLNTALGRQIQADLVFKSARLPLTKTFFKQRRFYKIFDTSSYCLHACMFCKGVKIQKVTNWLPFTMLHTFSASNDFFLSRFPFQFRVMATSVVIRTFRIRLPQSLTLSPPILPKQLLYKVP